MAVDRRRQTAGSSRIQEGSTVRSRHRVISTGRRATGGDRGATESRLALLGLGSLCRSARAALSLYSATEAGRPLSGQQTLTGPATLPNADATFTAPNGTTITLEGDTVRFIHLPSLDRLGQLEELYLDQNSLTALAQPTVTRGTGLGQPGRNLSP